MQTLEPKTQTDDCGSLLKDLYNLLETYAPSWYSHELHKRLVAILTTLETQVGTQGDS
jgi:hypothetical protein